MFAFLPSSDCFFKTFFPKPAKKTPNVKRITKKINAQKRTSKTRVDASQVPVVALLVIAVQPSICSLACLRRGERSTVSSCGAGVRPRQTKQRRIGGARARWPCGGGTRALALPVDPLHLCSSDEEASAADLRPRTFPEVDGQAEAVSAGDIEAETASIAAVEAEVAPATAEQVEAAEVEEVEADAVVYGEA